MQPAVDLRLQCFLSYGPRSQSDSGLLSIWNDAVEREAPEASPEGNVTDFAYMLL